MAKPKKRKARRTKERIEREHQRRNHGETMRDSLERLRNLVKARDKTVERLRRENRELRENEGKEVRKMEVLKNREIRKRETIIRNQKKKMDKLSKKKWRRPKVVYRNRWKEFEPSSSVLSLKKSIENASQVPRPTSDLFEILQKIGLFIEEFNTENETKLSLEHFVLLAGTHLIGDVRGVYSTRIKLYNNSPHKIRKAFNELVKAGLMKKDSVFYNTNALGIKFLTDLSNRVSYGTSEIIKLLEEYDD